jgi:hypothetical protein
MELEPPPQSQEVSPPRRSLARGMSMSNVHEPTALEQKMLEMKERFQMLQLMDENKAQGDHEQASEELKGTDGLQHESPNKVPPLTLSLSPSRTMFKRTESKLDMTKIDENDESPPLTRTNSSLQNRIPPKLGRSMTAPRSSSNLLASFAEEQKMTTATAASSIASTEQAPVVKLSPRDHWHRLRKVVRGEGGTAIVHVNRSLPTVSGEGTHTSQSPIDVRQSLPTSLQSRSNSLLIRSTNNNEDSPRPMESPRQTQFRQVNALLESEDIRLNDMWKDPGLFKPFSVEAEKRPQLSMPEWSDDIESQFAIGVNDIQIAINKIPEESIMEKKEAVERATLEQHKRTLDEVKRFKSDTIWRENLARKRIEALDLEQREKMKIERQKVMQLALRKESVINREFRKAREELEIGIRRQEAAVKEHFGKVLVFNEVSSVISSHVHDSGR